MQIVNYFDLFDYGEFFTVFRTSKIVDTKFYFRHKYNYQNSNLTKLGWTGGVVKVDIYEVDTKIELYVDTFWVGL